MNEAPIAYDGAESFVFVSYSHEDQARVLPLLRLLTDAGLHVWFDEGISPGNPWRDELAAAIDRCAVFLYFLTPASAESRHCRRECSYALDLDKPLLAVHLDALALPHGLTLSLADQQALMAYKYSAPVFEAKLISAVSRLLGAEPQPSAVPRRPFLTSLARAKPTLLMASSAALVGVAAGLVLRPEISGSPERIVEVRRLTDRVGIELEPALSPDGNTLAYVAVTDGFRQIWIQLVAGGAPIAITGDPVDHYGPRWSADSSSLIYYVPPATPGEHGTIREVPALGGPSRPLVAALGPGDPSHNGGRLAFLRASEGAIELAVAARDEAVVERVARLPSGVYSNVRWSPDDRAIAFNHTGGDAEFSTRLMVADVASGRVRIHQQGVYLQGGMAWLPDGAGFVASSARGSLMSYPPTYNLWRVFDGDAESEQLTFGEFSYESPDVAAQGHVLTSRVRWHSNVWKFPVDGSPLENARGGVQITHQTGLVQTVSVRGDESAVTFLSDTGGHANVWTARVADGELRRVTREADASVIVAVPVWSPTGDWIAYLSSRNSTAANVTIWLTRPDGSDAHDLGIPGTWVCWSPDGEWLYYSIRVEDVFVLQKLKVGGSAPETVRTDNAIGCGLHGGTLYYARVLANDFGPWDLELRAAAPEHAESRTIGRVAGIRVPSAAFDFQPIPSPDGRWLAMPLIDGSTTNLWALSTETGAWRRLVDFGPRNVVIARRIAWSQDGQYLYASVTDVDADVVMLSGLLDR